MINPKTVNISFLKELKDTILSFAKNHKIVLCTGGGAICRDYLRALKDHSETVQHIIGIQATRMNAKLVALYLQECNQEIPTSEQEIKELLKKHNLVISGGLYPGTSSDGATATIANHLQATTLINMTNVDGLFDKDPNKFKDALFIPKISHKDFKEIIDKKKGEPGQH